MNGWSVISSLFHKEFKTSVSNESDLRRYQEKVGTGHNLRRFGIPPIFVIILCSTGLSILGYLAYLYDIESVFTNPIFIFVFSFDTFLFLSLMIYGEERFLWAITSIYDAFETDEQIYFTLFGQMFEIMYSPSPFSSYSYKDRLFIISRLSFVTLFVASIFSIFLNANETLTSLTGIEQFLFLSYHFYLAFLGTFAMVVALWGGAVFTIFMTIEISRLPIYMDITRSEEKLGLEPYGRFVLESSAVIFAGVSITGWSFFSSGNEFSAILTLIGSITLPTFFIGSQYGIHKAIQRSKTNRLRQLRQEYKEDIDYWFSNTDINISQQEVPKQIRANSLINLKKEVESMPEWPTRARNFVQVGIGTIISNIPTIINFLS